MEYRLEQRQQPAGRWQQRMWSQVGPQPHANPETHAHPAEAGCGLLRLPTLLLTLGAQRQRTRGQSQGVKAADPYPQPVRPLHLDDCGNCDPWAW
jgi:hypothetical protein